MLSSPHLSVAIGVSVCCLFIFVIYCLLDVILGTIGQLKFYTIALMHDSSRKKKVHPLCRGRGVDSSLRHLYVHNIMFNNHANILCLVFIVVNKTNHLIVNN